MIITMQKEASQKEIEAVEMLLRNSGLGHCLSRSSTEIVIGVEKNAGTDLMEKLRASPSVKKVIPTSKGFKLTSKEWKESKTIIRVRDVEIGGEEVILMAGPCAIESPEQLQAISLELKKMGIKVLRGSAFKPRSSPYSFQGTGLEGLKWHREAQKEHGLVIETEVMDIRDVAVVAEHVDILRVGARNMQNFDLLKEMGKCGKPVILKRGMSATVEEWLMSAEYIMAHGNHQVILCERGIRTFETSTRNTLDLNSVAMARTLTHLPIIVDPSHAAGRKDLIPFLSKASVALGVDGLLIEVHNDPAKAKCDGSQSLLPEEMKKLKEELSLVALAIGRTI